MISTTDLDRRDSTVCVRARVRRNLLDCLDRNAEENVPKRDRERERERKVRRGFRPRSSHLNQFDLFVFVRGVFAICQPLDRFLPIGAFLAESFDGVSVALVIQIFTDQIINTNIDRLRHSFVEESPREKTCRTDFV